MTDFEIDMTSGEWVPTETVNYLTPFLLLFFFIIGIVFIFNKNKPKEKKKPQEKVESNAFKKFKTGLAELKIYLARTNSYIIIINSAMLLFLMLDKAKDYGINLDLKKYGIFVFILAYGSIIFIGWMDTKLGFFKEEARRNSLRNPYFTEIREYVEKIDKRLDDIEKRMK